MTALVKGILFCRSFLSLLLLKRHAFKLKKEKVTMAVDQKKRQKKLEKQKKKRKEKVSSIKADRNFFSSIKALDASKYPIYECYASIQRFKTGMGYVAVARKLDSDTIAVSIFLLDLLCLGVKNCFFHVSSKAEYNERIEGLDNNEPLEEVTPEYARKLVEDCKAFAKNLGINPHEDYIKSAPIFGNIDVSKCAEVFEFGRGGEPVFIPGPNDDEDDCNRVLLQLQNKKSNGN